MVSKSSAESEYRSLVTLSAKLIWIQALLRELCISVPASTFWCDNQSAAQLAHNPVFHSRAKHIELDLHSIREKVLRRELNICYIPSSDQIADILTKYLSTSLYCSLRSKLSVLPRPLRLRRDDSQTHPNDCNKLSLLTNCVTT